MQIKFIRFTFSQEFSSLQPVDERIFLSYLRLEIDRVLGSDNLQAEPTLPGLERTIQHAMACPLCTRICPALTNCVSWPLIKATHLPLAGCRLCAAIAPKPSLAATAMIGSVGYGGQLSSRLNLRLHRVLTNMKGKLIFFVSAKIHHAWI